MDVQLLNFNYTDTYKMVYGEYELTDFHYIHGSLVSNNLVLGVSDDTFDSLDYIYFQKYFQRIQKRTGAYYKDWLNSKGLLGHGSSTVHIVGHSLDKTDQRILHEIISSDDVTGIAIYYHTQLAYERQVINLIAMFGKDYIIEQTASQRITFIELGAPLSREE